ncbi:AAA family ATPase, partial [Burkholderia contaminans]|uniref:AAA family ATPase n=1 Tax=Burkholderia contaminans TaxID=488447 RepID=UPI0018DBD75D|nr:AAA family ATPase [Burkholderia contaminans]
MKIQSLLISGFRCLGPNAVHVDLSSSLPTLVGANGSGKTTILHALAKLFGITRAQRTITRDDFHVPSDLPPSIGLSRGGVKEPGMGGVMAPAEPGVKRGF